MYEVIDIVNDDVTRFIKLRNLENGTLEECFDDSAVVSKNNFSFMKIGHQYKCKIKLFGKVIDKKINGSVICRAIDKNIKIGQKLMVEVEVNNNRYIFHR